MFNGSHLKTKKVSLGGRSTKATDADADLLRSRMERERRKRQKLEENSSTTIQVRLSSMQHHPSYSQHWYLASIHVQQL
jgi:hypothetical protein